MVVVMSGPRTFSEVVRDVRWGIAHGFGFAVLYSIFAVILYLLRRGAFDRHGTSLGAVLSLYFAAGVVGGALVGALRPLTRSRLGSMVVGVVAMTPVFLGVGILLFGPFSGWGEDNWVPMLLGAVILGPMLGSQQWKQAMESTTGETE